MATMDKENLVNQLPSSPYTPVQKLKMTPKKSATKAKVSVGSRMALQETNKKEDGSKQQQTIEALRNKLAKRTQALRDAQSTISVLKVGTAASEHEVSLLRRQLAYLQQASSDEEHDEPLPRATSYKDLDLGFRVASLPTEYDYVPHHEEMLGVPSKPHTQHYKDLAIGFSVNALPMDF